MSLQVHSIRLLARQRRGRAAHSAGAHDRARRLPPLRRHRAAGCQSPHRVRAVHGRDALPQPLAARALLARPRQPRSYAQAGLQDPARAARAPERDLPRQPDLNAAPTHGRAVLYSFRIDIMTYGFIMIESCALQGSRDICTTRVRAASVRATSLYHAGMRIGT